MEILDSRQLRAFQLLAQTGSFTEAAKQMFLTQSAISHSIKSLEKSLGVKLTKRGGRTVTLTTEGESLLLHTNAIMNEMVNATQDLKKLSQWGHGSLKIGATTSMCQYFLPNTLREFRESYEHCDIQILSGDTNHLLTLLSVGEIDMAIAVSPEHLETNLQFQPLFEDELVFSISPKHPLFNCSKEELKKEMLNQKFLIYGDKSITSQLIENSMKKLGVLNPQLVPLKNMEVIREFTKISMGIGILPKWLVDEDLKQKNLVVLEMPFPKIVRNWGIFTKKNHPQTMTTEVFISICKRYSRDFE